MSNAQRQQSYIVHSDADLREKRSISNHVVHIRRLSRFEAGTMRDHLLRLDEESRQRRFGHAVSDEFLKNYVKDIFARDVIIKACFVDGICRGVGEAFIIERGDCDCEAAFSIEKRWQGFGLGTMLFKRLVRSARNRGCRSICVLCMRANTPMMHMAEKMKADIRVAPDGVIGEIIGPRRSMFSLQAEFLEDAQFMYVALPDETDDQPRPSR